MLRYITVCLADGILFGILDGLMNVNPYAQRLFEIYKPIAKASINAPAGIVIDIVYSFVIGYLYLLLYKALPGDSGIAKGIIFALIIWFFRVLMNAVSTGMTFRVPMTALVYTAAAGLMEMLILGIVYGLFLKPF